MSEVKEPSRLQTLLNNKLGITPKDTSVRDVQMPAKLYGAVADMAGMLNMPKEDVLLMLFEKMALSVNVTLDALTAAHEAKQAVDKAKAVHEKATHTVEVHVHATLGKKN